MPIKNDEELNKLLSGVTLAQGGVLPNIQSIHLSKKSEETSSTALKASNPANLYKNPKLINHKPQAFFKAIDFYKTKWRFDGIFLIVEANYKDDEGLAWWGNTCMNN